MKNPTKNKSTLERHQDQYYIEGIRNNNHKVINEIYSKFVPNIVVFINKNSGSKTEARDLIQDALTAIFIKSKKENIVLHSPFSAYLFGICRNTWLQTLRNKKKDPLHHSDDFESTEPVSKENSIEKEYHKMNRIKLMEKNVTRLGKKCQEILKMSWQGIKTGKIAIELKITGGYARKKKSECMRRLMDFIRNDAQYNQLKMRGYESD